LLEREDKQAGARPQLSLSAAPTQDRQPAVVHDAAAFAHQFLKTSEQLLDELLLERLDDLLRVLEPIVATHSRERRRKVIDRER
jgi:hypothetical protein